MLYYTRSAKDNRPELIEALFHIAPPQPAEPQREAFGALLGAALEDECDLNVMQSVQSDLRQRIEVYKQSKVEEPLEIGKDDVRVVLQDCGVSERHLAQFSVEYDRSFGDGAQLSPRNLVAPRRFELTTPSVRIQVDPDYSDLVQTRVLGGAKYLLINVDEGMELNGVSVRVPEEQKD